MVRDGGRGRQEHGRQVMRKHWFNKHRNLKAQVLFCTFIICRKVNSFVITISSLARFEVVHKKRKNLILKIILKEVIYNSYLYIRQKVKTK